MYNPFIESKPGIFKNECINIYPNFERYNYEKTNLSNSVKLQNDKIYESNNCSSDDLKVFESKTEIVGKKIRLKRNFTDSPGLDIGVLVDEMNKKVEKSFKGPWQMTNKHEINKIWLLLSNYIRECLKNEKSIYIANLGTFRVHYKENNFYHVQETMYPFFTVELAFAKLHKLNHVSTIGNIKSHAPCASLNYSELSKISQYPRDFIQHVVEKSILAIKHKISDCKQTIIIHFPSLGTMVVTDDIKRNILKCHRAESRFINFEFVQGLF